MDTATSLPTVSAKIVGDASGLVSELKRAETATSVSTAKIDAQVAQLTTRLGHRFSLAHMGTDILRGFGIGSGFHLAEKAAELIAEHWKSAAEAAKKIEESSAEQLKLVEQLTRAHRDDKMELAHLVQQRERLEAAQQRLKAPHWEEYTTPGQMGGPGVTIRKLVSEPTNQARVDLQKNAEELQRVGNAIDEVSKKVGEATDKATKANFDYIDSLAKTANALTQSVETPMERYQRKIGEIADAMNSNVSMETYNRLMARATKEYEDAISSKRSAEKPLTDSMTRFGMVGGVGRMGGTNTVLDKQVALLMQIRDAIKGTADRHLMEYNGQLYYQ